jgi:WD40 repeat protein
MVEVKKLHTYRGHNDCVYTLQAAGTKDPARFFSAAGDGMVVGWDLTTPDNGDLIAKLPNSVYALHHHPEKNLLVAGQNYEGIHLLDWKNKKETGSLQLTKTAIFDIQSWQDFLFVALGDGAVFQVDMNKLQILNKTQAFGKSARTIAVHKERGEIAVGYSDFHIRVFDAQTLQQKTAWQAHANSVFTLRYTPNGKFLLSGSRDARIKAWDIESGYKQAGEVVAHLFAINHLDFSPDGKHFVTCSMDKSIKVWDTEGLKLLKVIDKARHAGHGTSVNKLLWTTFDDQLLSASDDRTISSWSIIF